MTYGDTDFATLERNAWQRGDYEQAAAYALALEAEEARIEEEERANEANDRIQKLGDLCSQVGRIMSVVESAARVSRRDEILEMLNDLHSELGAIK